MIDGPLTRCFAPIANSDASLLVLGSMPGVASLEAAEYYAHPRNAFWPIAGELFGFDASGPYRSRCDALRLAGVAVWDVLSECRREGSLDASIDRSTEKVNDFRRLFEECPRIARVVFNGRKAEAAFRRHATPTLPGGLLGRLDFVRAPSTSPAHASLRYAEKLAAWRDALTR